MSRILCRQQRADTRATVQRQTNPPAEPGSHCPQPAHRLVPPGHHTSKMGSCVALRDEKAIRWLGVHDVNEAGSTADNLAELKETWETFGQEDPLWAVLTDPSKRGGRWDVDEFFATGEREVEALWSDLATSAFGLPEEPLTSGAAWDACHGRSRGDLRR